MRQSSTNVPRRGVTVAATKRVLLSFPGIEEGPCYGTPGFRARGKFLARLRDDDSVFVVKILYGGLHVRSSIAAAR